MIPPQKWTSQQLTEDLRKARQLFKNERLKEPLDAYGVAFDESQDVLAALFRLTADLVKLDSSADQVFQKPEFIEAFRTMAAPPISADDLKVLTEASLAPAVLAKDSKMRQRIVETVQVALDQRRFPWIAEGRQPSESERSAAIMATAVLLATRKVGTERRNRGKSEQEEKVRRALIQDGLTEIERRDIRAGVIANAPKPGEFCGESLLGTRKADFIVTLWDGRLLPIECKVSNSSTNSVKRLNNDAAVKAEHWRKDFGAKQVVPVAVLSGVFKLRNLDDAQQRGLSLFWAHALGELTGWIQSTKPAP